jgi:hypothetical protein
MLICAIILFTCAIVFPRLKKKPRSSYKPLWEDEREADDFLNQVKNHLSETKPFDL